MWKILCFCAATFFVWSPATADTTGAMLQRFGLVGTWSNRCDGAPPAGRELVRVTFAAPREGPPTRTMVVSKGTERTTIYTDIIAVTPVSDDSVRLRLRLTGGDRNGGPLPMINQNPFAQVVSKSGVQISLTGGSSTLDRCGG